MMNEMKDVDTARVRLGDYDFTDDENPLPEAERQRRKWQRMRLIGEQLEGGDERSAMGDGNNKLLSDQFGQAFALLTGPEMIDVTSSTSAEIRQYATRIEASTKWVEVLLKELEKEKRYIDELLQWAQSESSDAGEGK
jgi:hypothetical protein